MKGMRCFSFSHGDKSNESKNTKSARSSPSMSNGQYERKSGSEFTSVDASDVSTESSTRISFAMNVLGFVDHPNLVKLVGYCAEDDERGIQRLLVYEYMPNRSVQDHLSSRVRTPLPWSTRLKIAQDAARGLTYLHEEMEFQVIFRDFKSSNILLDENWNAKLSDFGLARLGPSEGLSHVSTALVGNYSLKSAQKLAAVANKCLLRQPRMRPKMSQVLEMVNQIVEAEMESQGKPLRPFEPVMTPSGNGCERSIREGLKRRLVDPIIGENKWLVCLTRGPKLVTTN
ncbi:Protein kinase, catalytic domain-containing protein [Cynara cardunculus var. scolymus]|uniref:non-specific serine/threonine protein kinase n=1 Tax=Cynara cardunculus var. scolymus TaxID=59895 RepID=A0A103Y9J0_CYNCS|nr:Protein kinase, catalytic domain-containing protein [Cynara cardunculus var. scolymus]